LTLAEGLGRAAWEADNSFDAGLFLAIVISHAGRPEEAETVFGSLVMQAATDGERAALAVSRSQNFLFLRRFDEAIACAEAAEATIADPAARAEVAAQRAPLLGFAGRAVEARALVVLALPDATGRAGAVLGLVGSMLAAAAGQATEAIRLNDVARARSLSLDTPLLWHPAIHRFVPLDALSLIGKLAEAEDLGQRWYTEAIENDAVLEQAYVACGLAKTLTRQGRVGGAARWAELADRLFGQAGRPAERSYALVYVAHALALGGSPDGARAALDEYASLPGSGGAEFGAEVLQARAWTRVAEGDTPSAIDQLVEAAELARIQSSPAVESMVRHDLARLGRATEVADRLAALAPLVEGTLAQHRAAHAAALSTGDG
jgi:tetratricopeptide (TPR) repeat protein